MDDIDAGMLRLDMIRVLELAIASNGTPSPNPGAVLRDLEEQGYTLRQTTDEERAAKRRALEVEIFGSAEPPETET